MRRSFVFRFLLGGIGAIGAIGGNGGTAIAGELEVAVAATELGRRYDDVLLREAAAAPGAATRRAAARAAARLKDDRALAWLLPLLKDRAGPVRRSALFALGQIGSEKSAVLLRSRLARMEWGDLPYALEALGKIGDPRTVAELVRFLDHPDSRVRGEAALALFRLKDDAALPDLFGALGREEIAEARWRMVYACWALLRIQLRRRERPVPIPDDWSRHLRSAAAGDRPLAEQIFAIRALGAAAGQRSRLVERFKDDDPRIVVAAVRSSTRPWELATARAVAERAGHEDFLVREAVVAHLLAGKKEALPLLDEIAPRLVHDPGLYLRVQEALAAAGREIAFLPPSLDGGPALREEARWRVLPHRRGRLPQARPETTRGRLAAAEVCGEERVPAAAALPVLLELLEDDDFAVRAVAIDSLAKRGAGKHVAAIVKAARASAGTGRMDVRVEAANALGKLGQYDGWLDEAAADPDRPVRDAARAALKKLARPVPPERPAGGFRLHGRDAAGVLAAAKALRGARVRLETSRGRIEMVLLPDEAPAHCVNLAVLVQRGFYDGLTWHRVVGNFVIQGGCPRGDGWGTAGYTLPDEIGKRARYVRGAVGMPKGGDDTGSCQIFITHLPAPHLDGRYTIFAQVVRGLDVVDRIRVGDRILRATIHRPPAASRR